MQNNADANPLPYLPTYAYLARALSAEQLAARHVMPKKLPLLNGNPEEWPLFYNSFETTTRICGYSNEENLVRLQKCLRGKALESVRSRLLMPSNVPGIIATLRMLYGRPELIINSLLQKLRAEPAPRADKLETIVSYSLAVQNLCATMEATGMEAHLSNPVVLQELVDKLPSQIKLNWAVHRQGNIRANLATFNDWISQLAVSISEVSLNVIPETSGGKLPRGKNYVNTHAGKPVASNRGEANNSGSSHNKKCCICQQMCSSVSSCQRFQEMPLHDKWEAVRQHKLCRTCLTTHFRGRCKFENAVCGKDQCTYKHHKLLHKDKFETPLAPDPVDGYVCNTHQSHSQAVLFRIVPVQLYNKNKVVETFAFLDDGSSLTLMEDSLAKQLDLNGEPEPLCLRWTANTHRMEEDSKVVSCDISGMATEAKYTITNVRTVKSLNLPQQTLPASPQLPHVQL